MDEPFELGFLSASTLKTGSVLLITGFLLIEVEDSDSLFRMPEC